MLMLHLMQYYTLSHLMISSFFCATLSSRYFFSLSHSHFPVHSTALTLSVSLTVTLLHVITITQKNKNLFTFHTWVKQKCCFQNTKTDWPFSHALQRSHASPITLIRSLPLKEHTLSSSPKPTARPHGRPSSDVFPTFEAPAPASELDQLRRSKLRRARTSRPTRFCQEVPTILPPSASLLRFLNVYFLLHFECSVMWMFGRIRGYCFFFFGGV